MGPSKESVPGCIPKCSLNCFGLSKKFRLRGFHSFLYNVLDKPSFFWKPTVHDFFFLMRHSLSVCGYLKLPLGMRAYFKEHVLTLHRASLPLWMEILFKYISVWELGTGGKIHLASAKIPPQQKNSCQIPMATPD